MRAERIGHRRQRLVERRLQELLVRHIGRHLAQAVHVVREADEPRLHARLQHLERMPHHRRARHLPERADMRKPRRAVARLEHHLARRVRLLQPFQKLARLFEGPGLGGLRKLCERFVGGCHGAWGFLMCFEDCADYGKARGARQPTPRTRIQGTPSGEPSIITVLGAAPALLPGLASGVARITGRFLLGRECFLAFGFFCGFKLGLGLFLGLLFNEAGLLLELFRLTLGSARLARFGCF